MVEIRTEITIAAPHQEVWRVLLDTGAYWQWNPLITDTKGVPEEGRTVRIRLKVKALPALWIPVVIITLKPIKKLCWTFTLPLGLFHAEHSFLLFREPDGRIRFVNSERFSGLLGGIVGVLMNCFFCDDYRGMNRALAGRLR
jgi:hypothetical protein